MKELSPAVKSKFYDVIKGDLIIEAFEHWVYSDNVFEAQFDPDDYPTVAATKTTLNFINAIFSTLAIPNL